MFDKIRNPIIFQGSLKKKNYFEGWYYKMVSADGFYSLALIPGISKNKENSHVFIQIFFTNKQSILKTKYLVYDLNSFTAQKNPFKLSIKNNVFMEDSVYLAIDSEDISLNGELTFINNTKIKTSWFSPSIMGYFAYIKFMECYHGVISMSHNIKGNISIDGELINFTGGRGYIEKDWGKSFPKEYVWMQSNNFKDKDTSFMFSEAVIPFTFLRFHGLIINLVVKNKEYRFATYNFAKVTKKIIESNQVTYEIKKGNLKLIVEAVNGKTTSLPSPDKGAMIKTIKEGLSGTIKLKLFKKNVLIYEDEGTNAGLEIMMSLTK